MENKPESPPRGDDTPPRRSNNSLVIAVIVTALLLMLFFGRGDEAPSIDASFFREQLAKKNVKMVVIGEQTVTGEFVITPTLKDDASDEDKKEESKKWSGDGKADGTEFSFTRPIGDDYAVSLENELKEAKVKYRFEKPDRTAETLSLLSLFLLPLLVLGFLYFMFRRSRSDMMGGGFLSGFAKSPAKRFEASEKMIKFDDVAGLEGVKGRPARDRRVPENARESFRSLAAKCPRACCSMDHREPVRHLLARAVAGEAEVPFYSVNGSEFIQMFVGVGASRVRDLFRTAKENSPVDHLHRRNRCGRSTTWCRPRWRA